MPGFEKSFFLTITLLQAREPTSGWMFHIHVSRVIRSGNGVPERNGNGTENGTV
jgi:hypothetical protein